LAIGKIKFSEKMIATLKKKRWEKGYFQPFYKFVWKLYNVYRFISIPSYRSRIINSFIFKEQYHQFSNFTKFNRYPDLFEIAKQHFETIENPKILSFGCSTGEEVMTISEYIPHATVIGVDINNWCLKQAKLNYVSDNRLFYNSLSEDFIKMTGFDAIFCLAVFQHPENRHDKNRMESGYPFIQFEKQLNELDLKLKKTGLLFIDNCDFNFIETNLMPRYQIANFKNNQKLRNRPIFNRNNQKIAEKHSNFRVFKKVSD
jgi:tRNA G46 methylase TrmB